MGEFINKGIVREKNHKQTHTAWGDRLYEIDGQIQEANHRITKARQSGNWKAKADAERWLSRLKKERNKVAYARIV